jgi:hypothetical protein
VLSFERLPGLHKFWAQEKHQNYTLIILLFNIYIRDTCNIIKHSKYWLFADDELLRATNSFDNGFLLQSDIERI